MEIGHLLPEIVPMTTSDWEKLPWKGALQHIGPVADATPLQVALLKKTNCALYMIYIGCVGLCIKRTGTIIEQKLSRRTVEMAYAYQFDWRYPKLFGITIEDVENKADKVTAVRRSIAYFFFQIVKQASTFFTPDRPVSEVSFMINLTRHLCGPTNAKTIDGWVQGMIERMNAIAAFPGHNNPSIYDYPDRQSWEAATLQTHGTPLPPEVLDLSADLSQTNLRALAGAWLNKLDPAVNPLLQPPEAVLAKGFQGIPYRDGL